jgi:hypothetical protein
MQLVPHGTIMAIVSATVPTDIKVWVENEAYRRDIPISWLLTELLKLGIEAYELIGPPETKVEKTHEPQQGKQEEPHEPHVLGDGPSGKRDW